jgi:GTP-binding protein
MILHLVSLENEDALESYYAIRKELESYQHGLVEKDEWIILTKKDLVLEEDIESRVANLAKTGNRVFVISETDPDSVKTLQDALVAHLRQAESEAQ